MTKELPECIVRDFNVKDAGADWHLHCKVCGKGWSLKKTSDHPGNILHLLNHARGCQKTAKANRKNKAALDRFFFGG